MKIVAQSGRLKFLLCVFLVLATAMPLIPGEWSLAGLVYLAALVVFIASVVFLERWPPASVAKFSPAAVTSLLMIALICLSASLFKAPDEAFVLLLPAVYAALFAGPRGVIIITAIAAFGWLLLKWQADQVSGSHLPAVLSGLLLLFVVVLVAWQQRRQLADLRGQAYLFANTDRQTGFLTMPAFLTELAVHHERAAKSDGSYALLLIDIDGLRSLNDKFGYTEGDRVIVAVADALKRSVRSQDRIARYGGDEFVVYLQDAGEQTAQEIANTVSQNIYNITLSCGHKTLRTAAHTGIAIYPDSGNSWQEMLTFADRAMYRDKEFRRRTAATESSRDLARRQAGVEDW